MEIIGILIYQNNIFGRFFDPSPACLSEAWKQTQQQKARKNKSALNSVWKSGGIVF
jgi:hypothetical protein